MLLWSLGEDSVALNLASRMLLQMSMVRVRARLVEVVFTLIFVALTLNAGAQSPLSIYTDRMINGFQDWSWATHNLSNTNPVHSGSNSISVTASAWQAL